MPGFSFNPKSAVEVGFSEGDYRVVAAYSAVASWAKKDGSNPKNTADNMNVFVELLNINEPNGKPHTERYSIGNKESYFPSADNRNPLPQSPRQTSQDVIPESERGNFVIGGDMTKNCGFYTFMAELGMAGFPVERMDGEGLRCLVGLEGHMIAKGKEKKPGAIEKQGENQRDYTTPVFSKILKLGWDGAAPVAGAGQAAAGGTAAAAAAKPAAPAVDKATMKAAAKFLTKALTTDAKKEDTGIEDRSDLKRALTSLLLAGEVEPAERSAIFGMVLTAEFFNEVAKGAADDIGAVYTMKEDEDGTIKQKK